MIRERDFRVITVFPRVYTALRKIGTRDNITIMNSCVFRYAFSRMYICVLLLRRRAHTHTLEPVPYRGVIN